MRSTSLRAAAVALAATAAALGAAALPTPAAAQEAPPSGADVVEACRPLEVVAEIGPRACASAQAGTWLAAQTCRRVATAQEPACPSIDGRRVHDAAMDAFRGSWLDRALRLQGQLDRHVPLLHALVPHTHNSANSAAYAPSLSSLDANQVVTITDQLDLGIRAIELDVHWAPHPTGLAGNGFREVVQCHGQSVGTGTPLGAVHAGCSIDQPLGDLLAELRAWLDANPGEVVLLYLENALDGDAAAHARAVELLRQHLDPLVHRPAEGAGCQPLPVATESRASIAGRGHQVLITGDCGTAGWDDWVFERGSAWTESGSTTDYSCAADRERVHYADRLVRRYEDSTWLSAMAGSGSHISPETFAEMVRCGVNLPGLDQLHPGDERLPGLVWSWAPDEPAPGATGRCAVHGPGGRFTAQDCTQPRRVACRAADGSWSVTTEAVPWAWADAACADEGRGVAGTPVNGWDNGRLHEASDGAPVWLAYAQEVDGAWALGGPGIPEPEPDPRPDRSGRGHGGRPGEPGRSVRDARPVPPTAAMATAPASSDGGLPAAVAAVAAVLVASGVALARRRETSSGPQVAVASGSYGGASGSSCRAAQAISQGSGHGLGWQPSRPADCWNITAAGPPSVHAGRAWWRPSRWPTSWFTSIRR